MMSKIACRYCDPETYPNIWHGAPFPDAGFICTESENNMDMNILYDSDQDQFHMLVVNCDKDDGRNMVEIPLVYCPFCGRKLNTRTQHF